MFAYFVSSLLLTLRSAGSSVFRVIFSVRLLVCHLSASFLRFRPFLGLLSRCGILGTLGSSQFGPIFFCPVLCSYQCVSRCVSLVCVSLSVCFVLLSVCSLCSLTLLFCAIFGPFCAPCCVFCAFSFSYFVLFLVRSVPPVVCVLCFFVLLFCVIFGPFCVPCCVCSVLFRSPILCHFCPADCRSLLSDLFSCIPVFVIPVSTYRPKRLDSWQSYAQRDLNFPLFAFPW